MGEVLARNYLYRNIYAWADGLLPDSLDWLAYLTAGFTIMLLLVNALLLLTMLYIWMERRLLARFQVRRGPNRWGPFGLLQPVADAIKILTKEDIVPSVADRLIFNAAPVVMFVPVLLVLAVIPFGEHSFLADINVAALYIIAVTTISTLAILMAGWASGNKYAMFGAIRGVAQLISYEVPVVLSIVGVILLAGSMSLTAIVEAQRLPFFLLQPLGLFVFLVGTSAELNRTPFDLVEAESELVSGYHIEYSGMKFGLFYLAEFSAVLTSSAIMATLFLQGWRWPFLHPHLWFLLKLFLFAFLLIWIRATLPRLRIDQVMGLAWKFLFPLSLINIFVTAVEVLLWPSPTPGQLWVMVGINSVVALVTVVAFGNLIREKMRVPQPMRVVVPAIPSREAR